MAAMRTPTELESKATRALNAFLDCVYVHADAMASGSGAESGIADRALGSCERQHAQYCTAASDYFTAVAPPQEKDQAVERAQARCAGTRADTREALIGQVLESRELSKQRLERAMSEALADVSPAR